MKSFESLDKPILESFGFQLTNDVSVKKIACDRVLLMADYEELASLTTIRESKEIILIYCSSINLSRSVSLLLKLLKVLIFVYRHSIVVTPFVSLAGYNQLMSGNSFHDVSFHLLIACADRNIRGSGIFRSSLVHMLNQNGGVWYVYCSQTNSRALEIYLSIGYKILWIRSDLVCLEYSDL